MLRAFASALSSAASLRTADGVPVEVVANAAWPHDALHLAFDVADMATDAPAPCDPAWAACDDDADALATVADAGAAAAAATRLAPAAARVHATITWDACEGTPVLHVAASVVPASEPVAPADVARWVNAHAAAMQGIRAAPADAASGAAPLSSFAPAGTVAADVGFHPLTRTLCCTVHPCGVAALPALSELTRSAHVAGEAAAAAAAAAGAVDCTKGDGELFGGATAALAWASLMLPLIGLTVSPRLASAR